MSRSTKLWLVLIATFAFSQLLGYPIDALGLGSGLTLMMEAGMAITALALLGYCGALIGLTLAEQGGDSQCGTPDSSCQGTKS